MNKITEQICTICKRKIGIGEERAEMYMEWIFDHCGTYQEYILCGRCKDILRKEIENAIYRTKQTRLDI